MDCPSVDNQSADSSVLSAEMKLLLKAGCKSMNDSEKGLKTINELMDTIRGSLVGEMSLMNLTLS